MHATNILTIYLKELRDLFRDRRTLISMVVVPTLLGPGLTVMFGVIAYNVINKAKATPPAVMVVGGDDSPKIRAMLAASSKFKTVPATADWKQRIVDKAIRAAVEIPPGFDAALERGQPTKITLYNYEGEMRSGFAVGDLRDFFSNYRSRVIGERLTARGLSDTIIKPFEVSSQNVAPPERVGGNLIGGLILYYFLLLSFTGAMYPALDLTAGEKERGTMETLLCSPVPRIDLVLGKFIMVLTASLGTVACSLASMVATVMVAGHLVTGNRGFAAIMHAGGGGPLRAFDPLGVLAVVAMVIPMAVLFAAVQFTIALFARSFKEAQSYVSPLIIVIIVPAVLGMLPGIELNARLALVPILNVALVSKELVSGEWHWNLIALIFASTCCYAAVALGLAVRMFNREDVIFRT